MGKNTNASRALRSKAKHNVRTAVGVRLPGGNVKTQLKTMKPQAQRELHYSTNQEVLDHLSGKRKS